MVYELLKRSLLGKPLACPVIVAPVMSCRLRCGVPRQLDRSGEVGAGRGGNFHCRRG